MTNQPAKDDPSSKDEKFDLGHITSDREWVHALLKDQVGDPRVDAFLAEFDKQYYDLRRSHSSIQNLQKHVRQLKADLVCTATKAGVLSSLYPSNDDMIASLKKDVIDVYNQLIEARDLEDDNKKKANAVQADKQRLVNLIHLQESETAEELMRMYKAKLQKNHALSNLRDEKMKEVEELRLALNAATQESLAIELAIAKSQKQIVEERQLIDQLKEEADFEEKKRRQGVEKLEAMRTSAKTVEAAIHSIKEQITCFQEQCADLAESIKAQHVTTVKVAARVPDQAGRVRIKRYDFEAQANVVRQLERDIGAMKADYETRKKEVNMFRTLNQRLETFLQAVSQKMKLRTDKIDAILRTKDNVKKEIAALQAEIESRKASQDIDQKEQTTILTQLDSLKKLMMKELTMMQRYRFLRKLCSISKKALRQDNYSLKHQCRTQAQLVTKYQEMANAHRARTIAVTQKILASAENDRKEWDVIFDLMHVSLEKETKAMEMQNMVEAASAEHSLYMHQIVHVQALIGRQKQKVGENLLHVQKLRMERNYRDQCLMRGEMELHALKGQIYLLKDQAFEKKRSNMFLRNVIENQDIEERKLIKMKAALDAEYMREHKAALNVIVEAEKMSNALIRRHHELRDLFERVKLNQSLLMKGENVYEMRCKEKNEVRLQLKSATARREVDQKRRDVVDKLSVAISKTRGLITSINLCNKRLSEVLNHPRNIHRWRNLQCRDPATYGKLDEINKIQKQQISKGMTTEETIEKIHELDIEYLQNNLMVLAQPNPEIVLQLKQYQRELDSRLMQVKSLTSDLNEALEEKKDLLSRRQVLVEKFSRIRKAWLQKMKKKGKGLKEEADTASQILSQLRNTQDKIAQQATSP